MKKVLALFLALSLLFTFAACGKNKKDDVSTQSTETVEFVQPEDYAVSLLISINPQFTVYLDKEGTVLAVDFMNDDAKSMESEISSGDVMIEDLIKNIVNVANGKGFFEKMAKITIELIDFNCDTAEVDSVLNVANAAALEAGKDFGLTAEIVRKEGSDTDGGESSEEPTQSVPTDSGSTPTAPEDTHTHSYAAATCTAPETCSCGATKGAALGHNWQQATCKAPKTCSTCGVTEGGKADHTYSNGVCSVCGDSIYLNLKNTLETGDYVGNYQLLGNSLEGKGVSVMADGDNYDFILIDRYYDLSTNGEGYDFGGKKYTSVGAGFLGCAGFELTDTYLKVKNADGTGEVTFAMKKDGYLVVIASSVDGYDVNMLLSSKSGEFLQK